jgi:hypothetical protein
MNKEADERLKAQPSAGWLKKEADRLNVIREMPQTEDVSAAEIALT